MQALVLALAIMVTSAGCGATKTSGMTYRIDASSGGGTAVVESTTALLSQVDITGNSNGSLNKRFYTYKDGNYSWLVYSDSARNSKVAVAQASGDKITISVTRSLVGSSEVADDFSQSVEYLYEE